MSHPAYAQAPGSLSEARSPTSYPRSRPESEGRGRKHDARCDHEVCLPLNRT